jgi:hypothetical protein
MYQIVCVTGETDRRSTIASGFCDEAEAWETAQNWINRRFLNAAYDHSKECWWLLDSHRQIHRIMVDAAKPEPRISSRAGGEDVHRRVSRHSAMPPSTRWVCPVM